MNDRPRNSILIPALIFLVLAVIVGARIKYHQSTFDPVSQTGIPSAQPTAKPTLANSTTPIIDTEPTPSPTVKPVNVTQSSVFNLPTGLHIPILMYHYIRDYHDPNDKIGVNLSVSPTTFAAQLAALKQAGYTSVSFDDLAAGNIPPKPIILSFDDGYDDAYTAALPALKKEGMKAVFYLVTGFLNKPRYLTDQQVKELDAAGMAIGSHTTDHRSLAKMSEAQQRQELADAKTKLEQLIGKPVLDFCYPAGQYNDTTLRLDQAIGYRTATTTHPGVTTAANLAANPFQLVRVRVTDRPDIIEVIKKNEVSHAKPTSSL